MATSIDIRQIWTSLRQNSLNKLTIFVVNLFLPFLSIPVMQRMLPFLYVLRFLLGLSHITCIILRKHFILFKIIYKLWVVIFNLYSIHSHRRCCWLLISVFSLGCGLKIGSNLWDFLLYSFVLFFDIALFFFVMPLESIVFVLMMQFVNAFVIADGSGNIISLSIVDFFYFPEMPHIHFVSHLLVDYPSTCWVYHQGFH